VEVGAVTLSARAERVGKNLDGCGDRRAHPISAGSIKWEGEEISRLPDV